jgi:hypothetical protein
MLNMHRNALSTAGAEDRNEADLSASSAEHPPEPLQIFTRLGVMLVIALGFGLAAQLLVVVH